MSETKGPILTRRYLEDIAEMAGLPPSAGHGILQERIAIGSAVYDKADKVYRAAVPTRCAR